MSHGWEGLSVPVEGVPDGYRGHCQYLDHQALPSVPTAELT